MAWNPKSVAGRYVRIPVKDYSGGLHHYSTEESLTFNASSYKTIDFDRGAIEYQVESEVQTDTVAYTALYRMDDGHVFYQRGHVNQQWFYSHPQESRDKLDKVLREKLSYDLEVYFVEFFRRERSLQDGQIHGGGRQKSYTLEEFTEASDYYAEEDKVKPSSHEAQWLESRVMEIVMIGENQ